MKLCCIYIFIAAFLFNSCKLNTRPDNESAINDMLKKYPELYGKGMIGNYKPVRMLDDTTDSITMQLLEADHGEEQIVVFSNQKGQAYAVPFPDNDDRGYWQFYDEPIAHVTVNKSFKAEMNIAFERLAIQSYSQAQIYSDLMFSLMQCRPVLSGDTIKLTNGHSNTNLPDSCVTIEKRNSQNMYANVTAFYYYFNTFYDIRHNRFFQFKDNNEVLKGDSERVIVYRKPCVAKRIYL